MALDLDAEFGTLRKDFLTCELDFLRDRVNPDWVARLARRRRRSNRPGTSCFRLRPSRQLSCLRSNGTCAIGTLDQRG